MSVDTGSIFTKEVSVDVTVKGGEGASIARGKGYGEGVGMEDSASVTTWLILAGRLVGFERGRVTVGVGSVCFC